MTSIHVKRIYEPPAAEDGFRVLVDRIWPRGVSKTDAAIDLWAKEIAPSNMLRKWFGHDPARWARFQARYRVELYRQADSLRALLDASHGRRLTLLYSARDSEHNQALVLKEVLSEMQRSARTA